MKEYIVFVEDDDRDYDEVFIHYIRRQDELIRCKDCKYFSCEHSDNGCVEHLYAEWTEMWCNKHFDKEAGEYLTVFEDDYCSWAERKEE